jgi:hypothetical protein
MRDLIKAEDLDILADKSEANTSTPSNPDRDRRGLRRVVRA